MAEFEINATHTTAELRRTARRLTWRSTLHHRPFVRQKRIEFPFSHDDCRDTCLTEWRKAETGVELSDRLIYDIADGDGAAWYRQDGLVLKLKGR